MGRRRQNNDHLPKHWQLIHGAYYYRVPAMHRDLFDKGRIWLGRTLSEAHRAFADLPVHDDAEVQLVRDLAEKYRSEVIPANAKGTQKNKLYYIEFILTLAGKMSIHAVRAKHAYQMFERVKKVVSKRSETNGLKTAREVVALFRHMFTKGVE